MRQMRQGTPMKQNFVQRKNIFASVVVVREWRLMGHALACR
jgi:hypothetical protein